MHHQCKEKITGRHKFIKEAHYFICKLGRQEEVSKIRPERKNRPENLTGINSQGGDLVYILERKGSDCVCVINSGNAAQIIRITATNEEIVRKLAADANQKWASRTVTR